MDSLTQMILGAAMGEVALGKKMGNRAMLWGAIGGTIPDLDVIIGNAFMGRLDALVFHRGFMHSFVFAFLISFLLAYLLQAFYSTTWYRNPLFRKISASGGSIFLTLIFAVFSLVAYHTLPLVFFTGFILGWTLLYLWLNVRLWKHYGFKEEPFRIHTQYKDWYKLFLLSIITHPMLDCFTTFGTQVFLPFSNYRVAFNNVAVVDPLYTVPFVICLAIAAFYAKSSRLRGLWNIAGIVISSSYMLFTIWNKDRVNTILENTIAKHDIQAERCMTSPSILNNILWTGVVEGDSTFYIGQYSFFDQNKEFDLKEVPKNLALLEGKEKTDKTLQTLRWFSNNYSSNLHRQDGSIRLNDLRYGIQKGDGTGDDDYIFSFVVRKNKDGEFVMSDSEGGPRRGDEKASFERLMKRIKGQK